MEHFSVNPLNHYNKFEEPYLDGIQAMCMITTEALNSDSALKEIDLRGFCLVSKSDPRLEIYLEKYFVFSGVGSVAVGGRKYAELKCFGQKEIVWHLCSYFDPLFWMIQWSSWVFLVTFFQKKIYRKTRDFFLVSMFSPSSSKLFSRI